MSRLQSSKVDRAIKLITVYGWNRNAAAKKVGVQPSTVYRAWVRHLARQAAEKAGS